MNAVTLAEAEQGIVQELGADIRIDPQQRERHRILEVFECLYYERRLAHHQGHALGPSTVQICQDQRVRERPAHLLPAMRDQIDLGVPWPRVGEVAESPNRHSALHSGLRTRFAARGALHLCSGVAEQAIDGRGTRGQKPLPYRAVELQVTMSLERGHKRRQQSPQPLSTDPIACFPEDDERLPHSFVVHAHSPGLPWRAELVSRVEQPNRVLAVIARNRNELVQNAALVWPRSALIPLRDRPDDLPPGLDVDSRTHRRPQVVYRSR